MLTLHEKIGLSSRSELHLKRAFVIAKHTPTQLYEQHPSRGLVTELSNFVITSSLCVCNSTLNMVL